MCQQQHLDIGGAYHDDSQPIGLCPPEVTLYDSSLV